MVPDYKFTATTERDEDGLGGRDLGKLILRKILKNVKINAGDISNRAKVFIPR